MNEGANLKLYSTKGDVTEATPRLAEVEVHVQHPVEAGMETLLGVWFLASEYSTGPVHGDRIDSLGLDENGSPVVVEYKRGVDAGVINQGLFHLSWLVDHRAEFERLVRDRLGAPAAAHVRWSNPRLICIAGDFTRYDVHAVREHRPASTWSATGSSAATCSGLRPWPPPAAGRRPREGVAGAWPRRWGRRPAHAAGRAGAGRGAALLGLGDVTRV